MTFKNPFILLFTAPRNWLVLAAALNVHGELWAVTYDDIAPILTKHCVICHNGPAAPSGLQLNTLENIQKGSQSGAVAISGNASGSELVRRIRGESQPRMPLTGPPFLADDDINRIASWIDAGMPAGTIAASTTPAPPPRIKGPDDELLYSDVAPIFLQRCVKCHRHNAPEGPAPEGLSLQTYADVIRGGDRLVIVPGQVRASELVRRIHGIAQPRMPFDGPPWLSEDEIRLISQWIDQGARDNDGQAAPPPIGQPVRLHGRLTGQWSLDGLPLVVDGGTRIKKSPRPGSYVEVRGYIGNDGLVHATRIRQR